MDKKWPDTKGPPVWMEYVMYVVLQCAVQVTVIKIEFTTLDQTRLSICWPSGRTGVKPGFVELVEPYGIGVDQRRSCSV